MKDASKTPRGFKKYAVSSGELKAALGIDWPGKILSVSRDYNSNDGFEVTMYVQPHELTGSDRDRLTREISIPVPVPDPPEPSAPRKRLFKTGDRA